MNTRRRKFQYGVRVTMGFWIWFTVIWIVIASSRLVLAMTPPPT
jgi:hypothetical protein